MKKIRNIEIIINPASGPEIPILAPLYRVLRDSSLDWHISVTRTADDIDMYIKQSQGVDAVAICGGDGTITRAAKILRNTGVPMIILPNGSANVIAKELRIPVSVEEAMNMVSHGAYTVTSVDMVLCNGLPLMLGLNAGFFASTVHNTKRKHKNVWGQMAYTFSAIRQLSKLNEFSVELTIDGSPMVVPAAACFINNIGNIGVEGWSIIPDMNSTDGYIDVVLLEKIHVMTAVHWLQRRWNKTVDIGLIKHWRATQVTAVFPPDVLVHVDDTKADEHTFTLKVLPKELLVVVPRSSAA